MLRPPRQGAVALDENGNVGLITSHTKTEVNDSKSNDSFDAWVGIHIGWDEHQQLWPGKQWHSKEPTVLFYIDILIEQSVKEIVHSHDT